VTHPAVRELFQAASRQPAFTELLRALTRGERGPFTLSGLGTTAKALYLVLLYQATEKPLLILCDGNKQAESLIEPVETFFHLLFDNRDLPEPQLIPALDVMPHQRLSPHSEIAEKRATGLWRLATQRVPLTIAPIASALLRTEGAEFYRQLALHLKIGEEVPLQTLLQHLESIGYRLREPVEMTGEYSLRGGILDVFPAEASNPVRIEFFGDEVESIRRFDVETQRSVLKLNGVQLLPLLEYPKSRGLLRRLSDAVSGGDEESSVDDSLVSPDDAFPGWEYLVPLVRPRSETLLSLMNEVIVILDEPTAVESATERLWKRLAEPDRTAPLPPELNFLTWNDLTELLGRKTTVSLEELDLDLDAPVARELFESESPIAEPARHSRFHIPTQASTSVNGNMPRAVKEAQTLVSQGYRVAFFANSSGELERLADVLEEYSTPYQIGVEASDGRSSLADRAYHAGAVSSIYLIRGMVRRGTVLSDTRLAVLGTEDLFEPSDLVARQPSKSALAAFTADIADLKPGDYVVHSTHGVGQFLGVREITQGDQKGDFMLLEYAGESKLYVPLTRLDLVQKFRGAGEAKPSLDRLGGASWAKTKTRVKAKMRDMADELLKLYAQRRLSHGFAFSPDSNWQREFEDAFEYTPTKDQITVVTQIKADMEDEQPMDRLLCGDVGFGKTEVAMRAAFKALGDGKQVAVLAPTTVLAFQHYETFKRRFASFPVRIDLVSRFRTHKEIKATLDDVADGKVDVLIGTHRLLSKDVIFHDLGLLVIDEEQRFGVKHKERLKEMRHNVDVLTMSATPIPRTLHMSLLGLRDMSVIETPPKDRLTINTVVAHFNADLIKNAVEQEAGRQGQVYFVHNRVDTIYQRAAFIQELVPNVRIGVGHGQMGDAELEKVLLGFMRHEYDVFVSTTIVENGIDIPLANTIIIENSERYGLSELYQLRGRVGRSNRRAYAYLLVPADTQLSEIARKRLAALKEFSDLGAGFKIAALDLELRGAGNLLGGEQHGHIEAVGYDTYIRLLEETVRELKGEEVPLEIHATINLGLEIRIPSTYISEETQRLKSYKRIADVKGETSAKRVVDELADRYGPVPSEVVNLVQFSLLKSFAERIGVESVERRQGYLNIKFHPQSKVDPLKLMTMVNSAPGVQFTPAGVLRLPLAVGLTPEALLAHVKADLSQLVTEETVAH
jgi:transcription-repair coupling factor (superfamily II helicase)